MNNAYLEDTLIACCNVFGVSPEDVKSTKRDRDFIRCRKAYAIISRKKFDFSLKEIATAVGKSKCQILNYLNEQPVDAYYEMCLKKCKEKVQLLF